jgi:hypothetical protein
VYVYVVSYKYSRSSTGHRDIEKAAALVTVLVPFSNACTLHIAGRPPHDHHRTTRFQWLPNPRALQQARHQGLVRPKPLRVHDLHLVRAPPEEPRVEPSSSLTTSFQGPESSAATLVGIFLILPDSYKPTSEGSPYFEGSPVRRLASQVVKL